ncbi:DUF6325 family protein [Nocardioides sp. Soil805]|uniref:DUF6325 family protein n=1 Tax=Nocardioides sp. Soil805 TaxID=1736416 RepID=UPI0007026AF2|nr:DUF6325 family protein [Nocardioides sp. Soil805]KRF32440.1 hypothetical protein ASG94_18470 [Nocardioides sp. Soil805]
MSLDTALGVVEYLVIELPRSGALAADDLQPLLDLARRDVIRLLDAEVVHRPADGSPPVLVDGAGSTTPRLSGLAALAGATSGLLDAEDVGAVAEMVTPGSYALVLVFENVWTATLATALRRHGCRLVASGQVDGRDLDAALDTGLDGPADDRRGG